ncbi:hypothetical protein D3C71_1869270 [compost metagenome]
MLNKPIKDLRTSRKGLTIPKTQIGLSIPVVAKLLISTSVKGITIRNKSYGVSLRYSKR